MYATYDQIPRRVRFEWISEAWQLYKVQWLNWSLSVLIYLVISIGAGFVLGWVLGVATGASSSSPFSGPTTAAPATTQIVTQLVINVVSLVINAFFLGSLYRMANNCVRGQLVSIGDLFSGGDLFLPMLGMMIVYYLLVIAGLLCLIVGVFFVAGVFWPIFALVADGAGVGNAISQCFQRMKQQWLSSLGFAIVLSLLAAAITIITCGIGLLVAQPLTFLCASLCYRDMIGMPDVPPSLGQPYPTQGAPGAWPPPPTSYNQPPYRQVPPTGPGPYGPAPQPSPPQSQTPGWPPQPPEAETPTSDKGNL